MSIISKQTPAAMSSLCLHSRRLLFAAAAPKAKRFIGRRSKVSATISAMAPAAEEYDYDIFTIGAGSGGVRASRIASGYGAKVAVCELPFDLVSSDTKGGVGGTCVLRGCVPKKLMVYASDYAESFKDSVGFGWEKQPLPGHSWTAFMEAKRTELNRLTNAYKNTLKNAKVTLLEGRGKIVGPHEVDVDGKRFKVKNIIIAVGGRPSKVGLPGAEHCITSDEALELPQAPKKVTVIGAGYIGMEFSGIFSRFGAEVHCVYRQQLPLRGFDEECRRFLADSFATAGLNLHKETSPTEIRRQADGRLTVVIKHGDGTVEEIADNDQVMMATGRHPNVKNLGLEDVGVEQGKGGEVIVDDYSRTNVPSIWAVGDVTNRIQLTPVATMEGMALAKTVVLGEPTKPDHSAVPSAVFSHPELATVGLTEEAAIKQYKNVDVYTTSFKPMRNTVSGNPLRTFMKIVVDADTDKLLGIHMIGDYAAEIMQGFAVCVKCGITKAQVDSTVGIHPSAAEELVTMRSVTRKIRNGVVV